MRRVTRLRQPRLSALSSSTPSTAHFAPSLRTASLSTSAANNKAEPPKRNRLREALWQGEAPGPADPYAQPSAHEVNEEKRALEAYEAELAELEAYQPKTQQPKAPKERSTAWRRPSSMLKTEYKRTYAPTLKEAKGYTPATSGEGLEEIGGVEGWWDRPDHWGPENVWVPYTAGVNKVESPAAAELLLRQAVVEALAVQQAPQEEGQMMQAWSAPTRAALDKSLALGVSVSEDGTAKVTGDLEQVVAGLFDQATKKLPKKAALGRSRGTPREALEPSMFLPAEEAEALLESTDASWKSISLADTQLKFVVGKRVFQITGTRIPDAKLAQAQTVGDVLAVLVRPEPPKKLHELLELGGSLELPNVAVHSRRQTPIDREKSVGRWKLIVKELEGRELPVTGHKHLDRHHEHRWTRGLA